MARIIDQRELRNDNAAIMRAVENGESFIVTRNGTPIADLVPRQTAKRQTVPVGELLSALAGRPCIDVDEFYADLDRYVDPDPLAVPVSRIVGPVDPRPARHVRRNRPVSRAP